MSDSLNRGLLRQYHYFQATSQGPSLSAALYFTRTAPNPAARSRYVQETIRVLGVLENELKPDASQDVKEWLVGGKCTVADLAFMPYMLMSMNVSFTFLILLFAFARRIGQKRGLLSTFFTCSLFWVRINLISRKSFQTFRLGLRD